MVPTGNPGVGLPGVVTAGGLAAGVDAVGAVGEAVGEDVGEAGCGGNPIAVVDPGSAEGVVETVDVVAGTHDTAGPTVVGVAVPGVVGVVGVVDVGACVLVCAAEFALSITTAVPILMTSAVSLLGMHPPL